MMRKAKVFNQFHFLTIVILLGLVAIVASNGQEASEWLSDSDSDNKKTGMVKPGGVKRAKQKKIRKTKDLPRHRIKRIPHGWKRDFNTIHKETSPKEEVADGTKQPVPAETSEGEPHESETRKLKKEKERKGIGRNFRGQGVGRGAARQAARGGADSTAVAGGLRPHGGVPMLDWNWGTVWIDDSLNVRGKPGTSSGGTREGQRERSAPGPGGGGAGRGGGRGIRDGNGGPGRGADNGAGVGGGGGRGGSPIGNPYVGEKKEDWRNQFVARLTPRPTRPPTPPAPILKPTEKPAQPQSEPQSHPQSQSGISDTPKPTPIPTTKSVEDRGSCQLCPGGATAAFMTRTLIATHIKCQDIANSLAMADLANCPMEKDKLPVDIEAYCGCPGKSSRGSCKFCADGLDNIWHNISIPALNDWTCQDVEDYCGFITNTQACSEMAPVADLCCGTWEEYWAYGDDDDDDAT